MIHYSLEDMKKYWQKIIDEEDWTDEEKKEALIELDEFIEFMQNRINMKQQVKKEEV